MKVIPQNSISDIKEREDFFRKVANSVNTAAKEVVSSGFGGRKSFISDVADRLGTTVQKLGGILVRLNQLGWIELARADLTGAMDASKVAASEIEYMDARWNFVVVQPTGESRIRLSSLYGFLCEDQRQNIKSILKLSQNYADEFNKIDAQNAFPLARAFLIWYVGDIKNKNALNRSLEALGSSEEPEGYTNSFSGDKETSAGIIRQFMAELGDKLLEALKKRRQLAAEVNKSTEISQVKAILRKVSIKPIKPENVLLDVGSGWRWIKLDADEHEEEGSRMQHCATDNRGDLISLRDKNDEPHVTMSYNKEKNTIFQIKGKQNEIPEKKYWPAIEKFVTATKCNMKDKDLRQKASGEELYTKLKALGPEKQGDLELIMKGDRRSWYKNPNAENAFILVSNKDAEDLAPDDEEAVLMNVIVEDDDSLSIGDNIYPKEFIEDFIPLCRELETYVDLLMMGQGRNPFREQFVASSQNDLLLAAIDEGLIRYNQEKIKMPPAELHGPMIVVGESFNENRGGPKLIFDTVSDLMLWSPCILVALDQEKMVRRFGGTSTQNRIGRDPWRTLQKYNGEGLAWALTQLGANGIADNCKVDGIDPAQPVRDMLSETDDLMRAPAPQQEESARRRPDPRLINLLEMRRLAKWRT